MKNRWFGIFLIVIIFFGACNTRPKYGDRSNWSAEMHFKVAQDAANRKAYKLALEEYDEILTKFADYPEKVAMANYEKAVIYYRMKKYQESYELLQNLKADLAHPIKAASLPEWLHVMVPIMHDQVEKKVFEAEEKKKQAEAKKKAKEDAKAQKARLKEIEQEQKNRAKDGKKDDSANSNEDKESDESSDAQKQDDKDESKEEESQDEWEPLIPFEPFE